MLKPYFSWNLIEGLSSYLTFFEIAGFSCCKYFICWFWWASYFWILMLFYEFSSFCWQLICFEFWTIPASFCNCLAFSYNFLNLDCSFGCFTWSIFMSKELGSAFLELKFLFPPPLSKLVDSYACYKFEDSGFEFARKSQSLSCMGVSRSDSVVSLFFWAFRLFWVCFMLSFIFIFTRINFLSWKFNFI